MAEQRTNGELLIEANVARRHAKRFRDAIPRVEDRIVAIALEARAVELDNLACALERQARKKP